MHPSPPAVVSLFSLGHFLSISPALPAGPLGRGARDAALFTHLGVEASDQPGTLASARRSRTGLVLGVRRPPAPQGGAHTFLSHTF